MCLQVGDCVWRDSDTACTCFSFRRTDYQCAFDQLAESPPGYERLVEDVEVRPGAKPGALPASSRSTLRRGRAPGAGEQWLRPRALTCATVRTGRSGQCSAPPRSTTHGVGRGPFRPRRPYASALRAADKPLLACSLPSRQDHGGVRNQERTVDGDSFESSTSPSRGRMWLAKSPPYNCTRPHS